MQKDTLKDITDKIESWCLKNEIVIFFGEINDNKLTEVIWKQEDDSDWEKYLNVFKNSGSKIITVTIRKNDIDITADEISDYVGTLNDDEKKDYNSALDIIKKTKGQIAYFILTFFINNTSYRYLQDSEWITEYQTVYDAYDFDDDEEIDNDRLSEEKIEDAARKIITDKRYLEAKERLERSTIAHNLTGKDGINNQTDLYRISRKAEELFNTEIRPEQEAELRKKILELKSLGHKKIEITSKLKISKGVLDKYYYTDTE